MKENRQKKITEERTGSIIGPLSKRTKYKENRRKDKRDSKEVLDRGLQYKKMNNNRKRND